MVDPVTEISYIGELQVRPYRRGTYLGEEHLEEVIERALGTRYSFGTGWRGHAEVTIRLFDAPQTPPSSESEISSPAAPSARRPSRSEGSRPGGCSEPPARR